MSKLVNEKELNEFIGYYKPMLGCTVYDDVFDVVASHKKGENGLTKVRLGTEIIRKFFYSPIKNAIVTKDNKKLLVLLNKLFDILYNQIGFKLGQDWVKDKRLGYSYGNNKLGKGILTINTSSAFLCPSMCLDSCKQCKNCYAMASEIRHESELLRNILNQIKLLSYDIDDIINDTIKALGNKKNTLNTHFIRFNSNGDILDNKMLLKANKIAFELKARYTQILSVYTYTHNKRLDLDLVTDIVVNQSDKEGNDVKSTIVLYKWDNKYFDPSKYILCLGDCSYCPYCKNKDDNRTVIFMAHGQGLKAINTVPQYVKDFYGLLLSVNNPAFIAKAKSERLND